MSAKRNKREGKKSTSKVVVTKEGRGKYYMKLPRVKRPPGEEVVSYRDHVTVVLDEVLREAVRAMGAFLEVAEIARGQCGLGEINLRLAREQIDTSTSSSLKTQTIGEATMLEITERSTHINAVLGAYSRLHSRSINRLAALIEHVMAMRESIGIVVTIEIVRECIASFAKEDSWWHKAAGVVMKEWAARDDYFVSAVVRS